MCTMQVQLLGNPHDMNSESSRTRGLRRGAASPWPLHASTPCCTVYHDEIAAHGSLFTQALDAHRGPWNMSRWNWIPSARRARRACHCTGHDSSNGRRESQPCHFINSMRVPQCRVPNATLSHVKYARDVADVVRPRRHSPFPFHHVSPWCCRTSAPDPGPVHGFAAHEHDCPGGNTG
ncbi:hypothetical protein P154DRAFT_27981 [Amniculicola lignicola CBS 123094]|uniref:Uncharacterized protein n=1 Tax=Amniculicola lignicola CBS 123094 TaxID=1392246 RepID=A0A6A5W5Y1_9PLEO|nr:hypothetical protein P154DRAFT_27981 [Amniculicola lignicola CBS 123094]